VLSLSGVGARYWRGTGWLVIRDDTGLWRPNTSIAAQLLFAFYAICKCCAVSWFVLARLRADEAVLQAS
jgi:hypothetical protein